MSLEVHTTFCVQIGGKRRVACECVVSRGQSSYGRYEHFARWSGRYEHFARFWRRGTIDSMPLYAQACNATFSARLDTKTFILLVWLLPSLCSGIKLYTRKINFFFPSCTMYYSSKWVVEEIDWTTHSICRVPSIANVLPECFCNWNPLSSGLWTFFFPYCLMYGFTLFTKFSEFTLNFSLSSVFRFSKTLLLFVYNRSQHLCHLSYK